VTERPADDDPSREGAAIEGEGAGAGGRLRAQRLALAEPRSFLSLIPRRDLTKVVLLLVFLVVIVGLQRRSGSIVKRLSDGFFGPPPPAQVSPPREPPRVRLAAPAQAP
jgi:hypothetical protein